MDLRESIETLIIARFKAARSGSLRCAALIAVMLAVASVRVAQAQQVPAAQTQPVPAAQVQARPSDLWPMYQFSADRNAVFGSPDWAVTWKDDLGGQINGGLSIVGDTLYVETFGKKLFALDPLTGKPRWSQALPNIAMNSPLVADGLVIAGTGSNLALSDVPGERPGGEPGGDWIRVFHADTGEAAWRFNTVGADMPTGAIVTLGPRRAFIFSNADGHAYALDLHDGTVLWKQNIPGLASMSSLAVDSDMVYGISTYYSWKFFSHLLQIDDYSVYRHGYTNSWALRAGDGQFQWKVPYGFADCSPAVGGGAVFFESHFYENHGNAGYNEVYAADAQTGAIRWKYVSPSGPVPIKSSGERSIAGLYANGTFYESLPFISHFAAFDATSGRIAWSILTHDAVKMSAVVKDSVLYFGDTSGYLYAVNAADGKLQWSVLFPSAFTTTPPVIVGRTLFVANENTVYAIPLANLAAGSLPQIPSNWTSKT